MANGIAQRFRRSGQQAQGLQEYGERIVATANEAVY
jgi:hypothetical protein